MHRKEKIYFNSRSTKLHATFHYPEDFKDDGISPVIMMATGDGSKGSNSNSWPPIISAMLELGIPVFIFDFFSLGNSAGDITKFNASIAYDNFSDALDILLEKDWVDKNRIGLVASSFGGAISILIQSNKQAFKVVCLKSPVSFIPESYETEVGDKLLLWKEKGTIPDLKFHFQAYLDSIRYNLYEHALNITIPILIVHGDSDTIVPIEQSVRLNCLLQNSILKKLSGVDHGYKEDGALGKLATLHQNFMQENL